MKHSVGNQCWQYRAVVCGLILWGLQWLASCAGDAPNNSMIADSEKSSAVLTIRWHDTAAGEEGEDHSFQKALNCQSTGVEQVVCEIYDSAGNRLLTAGPWPCTAGRAGVDGIPAGADRIFVVTAEDSAGNIFYHGVTTGVLIEPGRIRKGVVVDAYRFVPNLIRPLPGAELDPAGFSFEWEALQNADQYLIEVSGDRSFDAPFIDHTTRGSSYAPADLLPSTEYFWRVRAYDRFTNPGVATDFRRFRTTDCTYAISSGGNAFGSGGGSGGFEVTALSDDCEWIAVSATDWVQITQGAQGSGRGPVSYEVAGNPASADRTGTITAGGEIHTITQEGVDCTYRTTLSQEEFDESGGSGTIRVTASAADCPWEAASDVGWITLGAGAAGQGNGTITFTVAPNSTATRRTGHITIGGEAHPITQTGISACTVQITPADNEFDENGGSGSIDVTTSRADCPWTAVSNAGWIRITTGSGGSDDGTVNYTVTANTTGAERNGTITVAGRRHTVYQGYSGPCIIQISPPNVDFEETGGRGTIEVATSRADCSWNAAVGAGSRSWIEIRSGAVGTGDGEVNYTVSANEIEEERNGVITVTGQAGVVRRHTVSQGAHVPAPCTVEVTPPNIDFEETGGRGTIEVATSRADCSWTAAVEDRSRNWIEITSEAGGTGDGEVNYTVSVNDTEEERNGVITVTVPAGAVRRHTVSQAPASENPGDDLVGNWINVDADTRGLTRMIIARADNQFTVHVYASCVPVDCNWGTAPARLSEGVLSAHYDHGFATRDLSISYSSSRDELNVICFTDFTEEDGRQDYRLEERFQRD